MSSSGSMCGGDLDLGDQVAVGQLAALRPPGGAGGVDQGGEVVGAHGRAPGVHLVGGRVGPERDDRVDRAGTGAAGAPARSARRARSAGRATAHALDERPVLVRLDDGGGRLRVREDPLDLLGRGRLVDRHRDAARRRGSRSRPASTRSGCATAAPTRSPGRTPAAISPRATAVTSSANSGGGDVGPCAVGVAPPEGHAWARAARRCRRPRRRGSRRHRPGRSRGRCTRARS